MDEHRFDDLTRSLAGGLTRRRLLKGAAAGLLVALAGRGGGVQAASCGNKSCGNNPGKCADGCVCCVWANGNTRCVPQGNCGGASAVIACPEGLRYCPDLGRCAACCDDTGCDDGNACTAGACLDGVCVQTPTGGACDDGDPCTEFDTCQPDGSCAGVLKVCPDTQCTQGVCDGGVCHDLPANEFGFCDDGNVCTQFTTCQGGACAGGESTVCAPSANPCLTTRCDPEAGCVTEPKRQGEPCAGSDRCDGAEACDGAGNCVAGEPVVCAPPGPCQEPGVCNTLDGTCSYANKVNDTACDTGNPCTDDTCQAGACVEGPDVVTPTCAAAGPCQTAGVCDPATGACTTGANLNDNSVCDDGNVCTVGTVCLGGACVGTPVAGCCRTSADCPPASDACKSIVCDDGVCRTRFLDAGQPCDTGTPCVSGQVCVVTPGPGGISVTNCGGGAAIPNCEICETDGDCRPSGFPCQVPVCNDGYCGQANKPDNTDCSGLRAGPGIDHRWGDNDPCTINDICINGDCVGTPVVCEERLSCCGYSNYSQTCGRQILETCSSDEECCSGHCSFIDSDWWGTCSV